MQIDRLLHALGWNLPTSHATFVALWLFIIGVSVHDGYLVLSSRRVIAITEQNPVGRLLLEQSGGDVWGLLAAKSAGTLLAATLLWMLFWSHRRIGLTVCAAVAAVQFLLLLWLYLA
jgi:hypothetical protein